MRDIGPRKAAERDRDRLLEHFRTLALIDPLTELPNRRATLDRLMQQLSASDRHSRPLCAAIIDIDYFKRVNDVHGHAGGDVVLQHVARCIARSLRRSDSVGRIGGEEFLAILPDTELETAVQVLERTLRHVASKSAVLPGGEACRVTVSIGVAAAQGSGDDLIAAADAAMYRAKAAGRNRVEAGPVQSAAASA
jgi:diguanylate cyclase (GGDEF)-like protein